MVLVMVASENERDRKRKIWNVANEAKRSIPLRKQKKMNEKKKKLIAYGERNGVVRKLIQNNKQS